MSVSEIPQVVRHLLPRLRSETRALHAALEDGLNLLGATLTLSGYKNLLERFYGFYFPWEQALEPWAKLCFGDAASERSKVPALVEDLLYLKTAPETLPTCTNLPGLKTMPEALGSLYVREGATLGGQIIARHVEKELGLSNALGYRFFSGYGPETGNMWRSFQDALLSQSGPDQEDAIIASANWAFQCIHDWMLESESRRLAHES